MANVVVIGILLIMVGLAVRYIVRAKKSGAKCIGCPASGGGACTCGCESQTKRVDK